MTEVWTTRLLVGFLLAGGLCFVIGGLRFRRWAVEGRIGAPRFRPTVETVLLWLIYSSVVSSAIVLVKQVLRHV